MTFTAIPTQPAFNPVGDCVVFRDEETCIEVSRYVRKGSPTSIAYQLNVEATGQDTIISGDLSAEQLRQLGQALIELSEA